MGLGSENSSSIFQTIGSSPLTVEANEIQAIRQGGRRPTVKLSGNVRVSNDELLITADSMEIDLEQGLFTATGERVRILCNLPGIDRRFSWEGKKVSGNFYTKEFQTESNRLVLPPWYIKMERFETISSLGITHLYSVLLSTCESAMETWMTPWRLFASHAEIYSDNSIRLHHAVLQIVGIPVLYFPWLHIDRDWFEGLEIRQGHTNDWGFFLHVGRRFFILPKVWNTKLYAETRTKRGYAIGWENRLKSDNFQSESLLYWMKDHEPLSDYTDASGETYNHRFKTRSLDRYRIMSFFRWKMDTHHELWGQIDCQSDNDLYYEFFRSEYNQLPEPPTYLQLERLGEIFDTSVTVRLRVQRFNTTLERLPELKLSLPHYPILGGVFYIANQTVLGNYFMRFRKYDLLRNDGISQNSDYSSVRFDTQHFIYLPMDLGPFHILPRWGIRYTWYEDSTATPVTSDQLNQMIAADRRRDSVTNTASTSPYDHNGGSRSRWAMESGMEINLSFQNDWPNFSWTWLDWNGLFLRSLPYINYTRIPSPTVSKDYLFFFDEVDRLDKNHFIRFGLENQWFTLNSDRTTQKLLQLSGYWDYFIQSEFESSGNLGFKVNFTPVSWVGIQNKTLFDLHARDTLSSSSHLRIGNPSRYWIQIGYHRQDQFSPQYAYSFGSEIWQIMGSHLLPIEYPQAEEIRLSGGIPLGLKTSLRGTYHYDLLRNQFAKSTITLDHQFHCWGIGVGYVEEPEKRSMLISIFLTAFPETARITHRLGIEE